MTTRPPAPAPAKRYDAEYFERWYRRSSIGVGRRQFVERKVRLALSAAEYVLGRPAHTVLDVGCGEGPWRAILRRLRPGISYLGIDSSAYAVALRPHAQAAPGRAFGPRAHAARASL